MGFYLNKVYVQIFIMNYLLLVLVCVSVYTVNGHVIFTPWVAQPCKRPSTGDCVEAGTCCGEKKGTMTFTRSCAASHCDDDPVLSRTIDCVIPCKVVDDGAYSVWASTASCVRPTTGACSAPNTCCGQLVGQKDFSRSCLASNGCKSSALSRKVKCNVRCTSPPAGPVEYGPWTKGANTCARPTSGDCAGANTCCGLLKGKLKLTRTCLKSPPICTAASLEREIKCNLRCTSNTAVTDDYGPWTKGTATCVRPVAHRCSGDNTCCGELVGTLALTRTCKKTDQSCTPASLARNIKCNVRCTRNPAIARANSDASDYSAWISAGECKRPTDATDDNYARCNAANTCCGQLVGKQDFTRTCTRTDNNCAGVLTRKVKCNVRCSSPPVSNDYGPWSATGQCVRPTEGDNHPRCAADNTCCGELVGSQTFTRTCTKSPATCPADSLTRKVKCNVRCTSNPGIARANSDANDYSAWVSAGECKRPTDATDDNYARCNAANTCCGELVGKQDFTRTCTRTDNNCAGVLTRKVKCNVRCTRIPGSSSNDYSAWVSAGECKRPTDATDDNYARCNAANTCCGELVGKQDFTRTCTRADNNCGGVLTRKMKCNVRCSNPTSTDDYGPWTAGAGGCKRPIDGEHFTRCGNADTCCGELVGKMTYTRTCQRADNACPADSLTRKVSCNVRCGDHSHDHEHTH